MRRQRLPGGAGSETHSADDSADSSTPQASLEQFVQRSAAVYAEWICFILFSKFIKKFLNGSIVDI